MGVHFKYQLRWITNTAITCVFACSVVILILQKMLSRQLGHDYSKAFTIIKSLDASLVMAISLPVVIYILLVSLLVVFSKMLISHKIAGPLFRVEKCAVSLGEGDFSFSTMLRTGDQLNGLAGAVGDLRDCLEVPLRSSQGNMQRIDDLWGKLDSSSDDSSASEIDQHLKSLEEELSVIAGNLEAAMGDPTC